MIKPTHREKLKSTYREKRTMMKDIDMVMRDINELINELERISTVKVSLERLKDYNTFNMYINSELFLEDHFIDSIELMLISLIRYEEIRNDTND